MGMGAGAFARVALAFRGETSFSLTKIHRLRGTHRDFAGVSRPWSHRVSGASGRVNLRAAEGPGVERLSLIEPELGSLAQSTVAAVNLFGSLALCVPTSC